MGELRDSYQRSIDYIRLSVTDRCDLRCSYCLPKQFHDFSEPESWLSFDEIERLVAAFARLGVRKLRVTGGEPLTRRDLPQLVQRLAANTAIEDISLSTNAVRLQASAEQLRAAGVRRINVSLDSLNPERFQQITGGKLEKVLRGLAAARAAGMQPIKINMVVMQGVNEDEVEAMLAFCIEQGFVLRLIETMPVGDTGRDASRQFVNLDDIRQRLSQRYDLVPGVLAGGGPARYYRVKGTDTNIGFITPLSQHFCATCNRVRITAEGMLHLCLGQDDIVDLRAPLRAGVSDAELEQIIVAAIQRKPERHEFNEKPEKIIRFMSMTGG